MIFSHVRFKIGKSEDIRPNEFLNQFKEGSESYHLLKPVKEGM